MEERKNLEKGDVPPERSGKTVFSSWTGSLLFHLAVLVIAFWAIQSGGPKTGNILGERTAESVGIVFSDDAGGSAAGQIGPTNDSERPSETSEPTEQPTTSDSPLTALLPEGNDRIGMMNVADAGAASDTGETGEEGDSTGLGTGSGSGSGAGQTVGFGELKGKGRRFVYVLDRSESMRWPNDLPIRYALAEAKASVESLNVKKGALKFQLVIYNHDARIFGDGRLLDVNRANQIKVERFLDSVTATGGTDPLAALEKAIRLRPDVIFFLTDADEEIPPMVLARIRESRLRGRVGQIHVMEFGAPNGKRLQSFRRLADQNNGLYIFKDVTKL